LFELVVKKFGAYSTWEKSASPGRGKDRVFDDFCANFATLIGANSGDAVKHQIAFGSPIAKGGASHWQPSHAYTAILCQAAALEAKFITSAELPSLVARGNQTARRGVKGISAAPEGQPPI
jgi:hypothetical protein